MCGGSYFTPSGIILSPNFPSFPKSDSVCIYIISRPAESLITISLDVVDFQIDDIDAVMELIWYGQIYDTTPPNMSSGSRCNSTFLKVSLTYINNRLTTI